VPKKVVGVPKFEATAGALDFNWGSQTGTLVGAFFMFLYLDFIGSSITFVAMGELMGLVDDKARGYEVNM
jgi:AGZA family xanthine/uracil permease-like MFS transporter